MQEDRDATDDFDPYADDPLFTAEQAAEYLKVKLTTLNNWRRQGKFPSVRPFTDARYRRSDLNKFINKHVSFGWMELK
jgi:excisionase family DNA binding protein